MFNRSNFTTKHQLCYNHTDMSTHHSYYNSWHNVNAALGRVQPDTTAEYNRPYVLPDAQPTQNCGHSLFTTQSDHITPVLRELHWLPVRQRVDFKLALLVYKALHHLTAPYLVDDCQLIVSNTGCRRLRSADIDTCIVPRTNTRLGDRNFAIAGPRFWNSLPAELR